MNEIAPDVAVTGMCTILEHLPTSDFDDQEITISTLVRQTTCQYITSDRPLDGNITPGYPHLTKLLSAMAFVRTSLISAGE
jgi:hypothetical protein